jgi:transposase
MRKPYPSDITREQYELIRENVESSKKITRPRKYDLYEIICAILYIVKEGCTWRALPHDYPDYDIVYYYFSEWSKKDEAGKSLLDRILAEIVIMERLSNDRNPNPTLLIVDSKSIQNADTAGEKGYDAGEKLQVSKYISAQTS